MEKTLVLVKPDGVKRNLLGKIISRYENRGLCIENIKMLTPSESLLKKHYEEHLEKPFFKDLLKFMTSGNVVAMIISGENAVEAVRMVNGATDSLKALPGTIRGDFGLDKTMNLVHGSDSLQSAEREINIWFFN